MSDRWVARYDIAVAACVRRAYAAHVFSPPPLGVPGQLAAHGLGSCSCFSWSFLPLLVLLLGRPPRHPCEVRPRRGSCRSGLEEVRVNHITSTPRWSGVRDDSGLQPFPQRAELARSVAPSPSACCRAAWGKAAAGRLDSVGATALIAAVWRG